MLCALFTPIISLAILILSPIFIISNGGQITANNDLVHKIVHNSIIVNKTNIYKEFSLTSKELKYALYIPTSYKINPPMFVGLHGYGGDYANTMYYPGILNFAENNGIILLSPRGYNSKSWFGARDINNPPNKIISKKAENDVMTIVKKITKEYNISKNNIFLWGHSMGGGGVQHLAIKYNNYWNAIGLLAPGSLLRGPYKIVNGIKKLPVYIGQGVFDPLIFSTRDLIDELKTRNLSYIYNETLWMNHVYIHVETINSMVQFFKTNFIT